MATSRYLPRVVLGTSLIVALLLPLFISTFHLYRRETAYFSSSQTAGAFIYDEIFHHVEPIDILFLGSSLMWKGIDARYVQTELEKRFGRTARVRLFGWPGPSEDYKVKLLRDLLARRKVDLVITFMREDPTAGLRFHRSMSEWLQPDDLPLVVGELSWQERISLYGVRIVGAPRQLLGWWYRERSPKFSLAANDLGSSKLELGYEGDRFYPVQFPIPEIPAREMIYDAQTKSKISFKKPTLSAHNLFLLREMYAEIKNHGGRLAFIHVPYIGESRQTTLVEAADWSGALNADIPLIGVPGKRIFGDLRGSQIRKLFYDGHMNKNGMEYFTKLITPAILKVYEPIPGVARCANADLRDRRSKHSR